MTQERDAIFRGHSKRQLGCFLEVAYGGQNHQTTMHKTKTSLCFQLELEKVKLTACLFQLFSNFWLKFFY